MRSQKFWKWSDFSCSITSYFGLDCLLIETLPKITVVNWLENYKRIIFHKMIDSSCWATFPMFQGGSLCNVLVCNSYIIIVIVIFNYIVMNMTNCMSIVPWKNSTTSPASVPKWKTLILSAKDTAIRNFDILLKTSVSFSPSGHKISSSVLHDDRTLEV